MPIVLAHTPGEWDGTFAFTIEAMIRNLLDDGPIELFINNETRPRNLLGCQGGYLVFDGNQTEELTDVRKVVVP